jgi:hypothetical protein
VSLILIFFNLLKGWITFFFEKKYANDTLHAETDDVLIASLYFNHHGGG